MSKYSKMSRVSKRGSVDSKYFGKTEQFEKDVKDKINKTEEFKSKIRDLILEEPPLLEQRYHNAIDVLIDIKNEFGI